MNKHVNAIAGRLSLRPPQRRSLEILDHITEIASPNKTPDLKTALAVIHNEYPSVSDFERDFPSLCFALATGVGKTRLMGAFISYLHLAHGINHFFVLAPNLTIYNKLIADFTPNTPKYVFRGIAEFANNPPEIINGDNYDQRAARALQSGQYALDGFRGAVHINIFNISKINSEVRGGKSPRIKRLSEYIGESYFNYLANLPDLVLLMDESHRYRASAGARAINELKPILGLELTATPYIETSKGTQKFKNIIYDYPLAQAMQDGFVKEPAVVTQKDFDPRQFDSAKLEKIKLQDGIRLHEATKVELLTYTQKTRQPLVKPFVLVIARDTAHASALLKLIESQDFFDGRYIGKAIQVDSSKTGEEEDKMVTRLLAVEHPNEPTEIVIHVNMLKEGWDVTNLYTIVPLRAASARVLIEQSIGRGLRLPFGKRTEVEPIDRLSIVAHDRFQEIVDEARRPDSPIKLRAIEVDFERDLPRTTSLNVVSTLAQQLAAKAPTTSPSAAPASGATPIVQPLYPSAQAQSIASAVFEAANQMQYLPSIAYLQKPDIQAQLVREVQATYSANPSQTAQTALRIEATPETPEVTRIVKEVVSLMVQHTIEIPRIVLVPKGNVTIGYQPFQLNLGNTRLNPVSNELYVQYLRTQTQQVIQFAQSHVSEQRLEDYIVRGLMDFNDIDYETHADLLYNLASQVVQHLQSYLDTEQDVRNVLTYHQKSLVELIHAQMLAHRFEHAVDYEVKVNAGFSELKPSAVTVAADMPVCDFRDPIGDKQRIGQMVFGNFNRCLFKLQKFDSDSERRLAVILDRDGQKWFRPARDQFQIYYQFEHDSHQYCPDFVVEDVQYINMIECKSRRDLTRDETNAKAEAARRWCELASHHARQHGGKTWRYNLIPHDVFSENMSLDHLLSLHTK